MKRTICSVLVVVFGLSTGWAYGVTFHEEVREGVRAAASKAAPSLVEAGLPAGLTVGILPIRGDRGQIVEQRLRSALVEAGVNVVAIREDPLWNRIWEEIETSVRRDDILDPATLSEFGRLQGTQALLYGVVREADITGNRVFVEVDFHLSEIETARYLWGGTFSYRDYIPGPEPGGVIIDLNRHVRALLHAVRDQGVDRLRTADTLTDLRTVAMVPLSGDIDGYVTSLAESMISHSNLNPVDIGARSRAEALYILRDQPERADAVLFGAVRDLSRTLRDVLPWTEVYDLHAEVQFSIRAIGTGEILWSETIAVSGDEEVRKPVMEIAQEYWKPLLIVLGAFVALIVLFKILGATKRVR